MSQENGSITIDQQYGLSRSNFILDPLTDSDCFARSDVETRSIAESLDTDLVTSLAPKRLVWGPYGSGKTHTLMRTMKELGRLTNIQSFRVECPDLSRKSRFHDLHREGVMRELGQDFVVGLVEEARVSAGNLRRDEMLAKLKERFQDEEIAKGAIRLVDPHFEPLRLWRWISGVPLSRGDLDDLGQTQDLSQAEAARLADVIQLIGRLLFELHGTRLVLILDEMERLKDIGPETITTFVSGFARLVDPSQSDVSVLMGASADVQSEMVEVFSQNGPVVTRLGQESLIEIPAMQDPDVDRFIQEVITYVREPTVDLDALLGPAKETTSETVSPETFPFTNESIEALKSRLSQMLPREITMRMTRALGRAFRSGSLVVTQDSIV